MRLPGGFEALHGEHEELWGVGDGGSLNGPEPRHRKCPFGRPQLPHSSSCSPGGAGWPEGTQSAGDGEEPDGTASQATAYQLETGRPGRIHTLAADRLDRHDPRGAKSLKTGRAQSYR